VALLLYVKSYGEVQFFRPRFTKAVKVPLIVNKSNARVILWFLLMNLFQVVAHRTNENPQTIGKWIPEAERLLNLNAPISNWYGPTAAILMTPFTWLDSTQLFVATLVYFNLGIFFYFKIVNVFIPQTLIKYIALYLPFLNLYLFRLIDSSPDTVFEFFLLSGLMWYCINKNYPLILIFGILLAELRSGYWVLIILITLIFVLFKRDRKRLILLFTFPVLLVILTLNLFIYGIFAPASEGARTAYFSNNQYAYLLESSYQIDHFFDGDNGPMRISCKTDKECQENTLADLNDFKRESAMSFLNKIDTYFFSVQKVPRLPGWFELDIKNSTIKIGETRLSWLTVFASAVYFVFKSLLHILVISALFLYLFSPSSRRRHVTLSWLFLPWLAGSIPAILFFAETRVWIVSEFLLVPVVLQIIGSRKKFFNIT
jgi:hypothetical protein